MAPHARPGRPARLLVFGQETLEAALAETQEMEDEINGGVAHLGLRPVQYPRSSRGLVDEDVADVQVAMDQPRERGPRRVVIQPGSPSAPEVLADADLPLHAVEVVGEGPSRLPR